MPRSKRVRSAIRQKIKGRMQSLDIEKGLAIQAGINLIATFSLQTWFFKE